MSNMADPIVDNLRGAGALAGSGTALACCDDDRYRSDRPHSIGATHE